MAKHKHPSFAANPASDLRRRVDKAMKEGRYQTALDLGKQLYRQEATPEHCDLLFRCHLGRAKELSASGRTRDAATVLENALTLAGNDPTRCRQIADAFVTFGELRRALQISEWLPEPRPTADFLAHGADAALQRGAQGRGALPESMHADFDCIRTAFTQLAAGADEQTKESLQGIGLQSPFLEWKVFLRGLSAYYQNDDQRAIDNWSRLDARRLPARLVAPFRFRIDEPFRAAQPAPTQQALRVQADNLHDDTVLAGFRRLQHHCLQHQGLRAAFHEAAQIVPLLRNQAPHLIPKLASCLYWQIVEQGEPPDMQRYQALLGRPLDDPNFNRMGALITESLPSYHDAHQHWQDYEKTIKASPMRWPEAETTLARALIWFRMGRNAEKQDELVRATRTLASEFLGPRDRPAGLKPTAEQCLRKAIELAPDWIEPHAALFELLRRDGETQQAIVFGRKLVQQFPEHHPTLEALAELLQEQNDFAGAIDLLEKAQACDPLNRKFGPRLGYVRRRLGEHLMHTGNFGEARAAFASALQLADSWQQLVVLCYWAAGEFKTGDNTRAEELLRQAAETEAERPVISALMLAQAVQLKLAKPIKARFEAEFKQVLAAPPTPATASRLIRLFSQYELDRTMYHGQKAHQKKILALVERTHGMPFSEDDMRRLGAALVVLHAQRLLRRFTRAWRAEHRDSPYPLYWELESYLNGDSDRWPLWRLKPMAEQAKQLAEKMPAGEVRDALLDALTTRLRHFHDLHPFASVFEQMRDHFASDPDADEGDGELPW